jgi:hypothetical protein
VSLPFLNALVPAFGFRTIESLTAIAPGPGEVLLDEPLMARLLAAGKCLGRGELELASAAPNVCPICHNDAFTLQGNRATCPICSHQATVEQENDGLRLHFDPIAGGDHRWTPEGLRSHMIDWVKATGPRFLARHPEIKERRAPYRQMDVTWLRPPSAQKI